MAKLKKNNRAKAKERGFDMPERIGTKNKRATPK